MSRYVCAHDALLCIWFPVWFVPSCCWRLGMEQAGGAELVLYELMLFFSPRLQRLSPEAPSAAAEARIRCLLATGHARTEEQEQRKKQGRRSKEEEEKRTR